MLALPCKDGQPGRRRGIYRAKSECYDVIMTTKETIAERERILYTGFVDASESALKDVLADNFIYQHTTGRPLSREEIIEIVTSGEIVITRADTPEITMRMYDQIVVTFGQGLVVGKAGEQTFSQPLRFLNVWCHVDGQWRLTNRNSQLI